LLVKLTSAQTQQVIAVKAETVTSVTSGSFFRSDANGMAKCTTVWMENLATHHVTESVDEVVKAVNDATA
jgi:hypothetical protein